MPDLAGAYHDARERMAAMVAALDDTSLHKTVPACPDWSVRDLIAHVSSIATELSSGRIPEDLNLVQLWDDDTSRRREAFIAGALAARRDMSIAALLAEWAEHGARLEAMLRGEQPMPEESPPLVEWIVVTDVGVHLQDLAGALDDSTQRDALATGLALRSYVEGMKFVTAVKKLPPLRINAGTRSWTTADGEPVATVTADPWELSRAVSGRRNAQQIRDYDWQGDPEPFIQLFYPYGERAGALVE